MTINGSLCVVSGATEGIGRAIAGALGERGARLALCARTAERVHTTVDDLESHGVDAGGAACDVSDETSVTDFAAPVAKTRWQAMPMALASAMPPSCDSVPIPTTPTPTTTD